MVQIIKDGFVPKVAQIKKQLREEILAGRYELGSRMASERVLVDRFKVSRRIVRQALKYLETERLVLRQQGRGTFVSNPVHTRDTEMKQTGIVAVLVPDLAYAYDRTIQGASSLMVKRGYSVATGCNYTKADEATCLGAFIQSGVVGVLLSPRSPETRSQYETLLKNNIPVVFIDVVIQGYQEDYVEIENMAGTKLATQHLIELGHRRIAYVSHHPDQYYVPGIRERRSGFLATCVQAGLAPPAEWILEKPVEETLAQVAALLKSEDRPTAFVTYNDNWALRVIRTARQIGLKVPEDLSVVGFDNSVMAGEYDIPLTTVDPEHREMGVAAAELLLHKIENPIPRPKRGIFILPHLVLRTSTAKPPY
jgi:GntR family transcriptional regulator, arabinose operon transcriptional repressor